jgi:hypothetical protein
MLLPQSSTTWHLVVPFSDVHAEHGVLAVCRHFSCVPHCRFRVGRLLSMSRVISCVADRLLVALVRCFLWLSSSKTFDYLFVRFIPNPVAWRWFPSSTWSISRRALYFVDVVTIEKCYNGTSLKRQREIYPNCERIRIGALCWLIKKIK